MGTFLKHEPCPGCGSRNNLARYADGSATCFGCAHWEPPDERGYSSREDTRRVTTEFIPGECRALEVRGITKETCERWGYQCGEDAQGRPCHIANYRNTGGTRVAQKLRRPGKEFSIVGDGKGMPLYGQWLWGPGKSVVITEGELDALSMAQAFDNKWPVVSVPHGAQSAAKELAKHYAWLDGYEKIVLMFDQDEPGQQAVEACSPILPVGKVHIAVTPCKDANETLVQKGPAALVQAFWNAKPWRPDGIVSGEEFTLESVFEAPVFSYTLPYPKLQEMTMGLRKAEVTMITAGTGIGKSTWARELAYYLHQTHGCSIGNVFLEERNAKTVQAYVAIDNNVPFGRLRADPSILTNTQKQASLDKLIHQGMWFYNHFGSLASDNLFHKLRYLATVCGVDFIVLDHISIVISGQESGAGGERKDIDLLMTRLASLAVETGVGIIAIVHLNQPEGTPHEEGGRVTLRHLRGSGALKQLSDNVYALERDQQGEKPTLASIRVLKCREIGETGLADTLDYNRQTGRLLPIDNTAAFAV